MHLVTKSFVKKRSSAEERNLKLVQREFNYGVRHQRIPESRLLQTMLQNQGKLQLEPALDFLEDSPTTQYIAMGKQEQTVVFLNLSRSHFSCSSQCSALAN